MSDRITQLLHTLYTAQQAETTYQQLMKRLEKARQSVSAVVSADIFSERDALLITYGDSLLQPGEVPLQTLRVFAERYLQDVVSAIHILPFYPYSSDDGFSVKDFYRVNPALGSWEDVQQLGLHFDLMYDAVINHMSAQSEWFQQFLADHPDYQHLFFTAAPDADLAGVTRPRTSPVLTPFVKPNGDIVHVWTTFSADQVDFNVSDPQTLLRLLDILLFYVEQGARIIRLDAIAYLWKRIGTTCIHLPQTHTVIQLIRAVLDEVAPQVILITETNVPHHENIAYFGDGTNEAQLVYNFTLPPLLLHTLLAGDTHKLREWVNTLAAPSPRTTFFNFTASHDGIGVRPVEGILNATEFDALIQHTQARGGRVSYKNNPDGTQSPYELNITYVDAVTDPTQPVNIQAAQFLVSQAIMLSLAGVPAVYIHSLVGSHNNSDGMLQPEAHNRTINRAKLELADLIPELENPASFRAQVFNRYRGLIQVRVRQRAFHPNGTQQAVHVGNDAIFALQRTYENAQILCLFNVTHEHQSMATLVSGYDLITQQPIVNLHQLDPYQILWLQPS